MSVINSNKISNNFPFPKFREHQLETLQWLDTSLSSKDIALLCAPVGSGKSPIAIAIAKSYKNAHIITTQKTLQDQYAEDFGDSIFVMKGKSNYKCSLDNHSSCSSGLCKTNKKLPCFVQRKQVCPYYIALTKAQSSAIVMHNFASFIYQAEYTHQFEQREVLIIDEAHNVEKALMDFISFKLSSKKLGFIIPKRGNMADYIDVLRDIRDKIIERLGQLKKTQSELSGEDLNGSKRKALSPSRLKLQREKESAIFDEMEDLDEMKSKITFFLSQVHDINNWIFNVEFDEHKYVKFLEIKPVVINQFTHRFLFSYGKKIVAMSATIDKQSFCDSLGLDESMVEFHEIPSTFPIDNRPIFKSYIGYITRNSLDDLLPKIAQRIDHIMHSPSYANQKGIIHTHTYKIAQYIRQHVISKRFIFHDELSHMTREEALKLHIESDKPTILVTPSMTEGINLIDDLARWQIIVKVPHPYLGDKQVRARMYRDPLWYQMQAIITMQQTYGRIVRSEFDTGDTYVLDAAFEGLLNKYKNNFNKWFLEAVS